MDRTVFGNFLFEFKLLMQKEELKYKNR
jgi:hypothetical protein